MKQLKYVVFLLLIVLTEAGLIYGMFVFVSVSKLFYVFVSLALVLAGIAYLVVSRYCEKVKIKPKTEVWNGYIKALFTAFVVFFIVLASLVFIRALVFVIRGF